VAGAAVGVSAGEAGGATCPLGVTGTEAGAASAAVGVSAGDAGEATSPLGVTAGEAAGVAGAAGVTCGEVATAGDLDAVGRATGGKIGESGWRAESAKKLEREKRAEC
jgi:hypothetical protein